MRNDVGGDDRSLMGTQQRTSMRKRGEDGASLVEYVLLLSLIVVVCLVSVTYFGTRVSGSFSQTASTVDAAR